MKAPCYQCPDRHIGCHAECEAFQEYDRQNKERQKQNLIDSAADRARRAFRNKHLHDLHRGRHK